jgi:hypothetical protein
MKNQGTMASTKINNPNKIDNKDSEVEESSHLNSKPDYKRTHMKA